MGLTTGGFIVIIPKIILPYCTYIWYEDIL